MKLQNADPRLVACKRPAAAAQCSQRDPHAHHWRHSMRHAVPHIAAVLLLLPALAAAHPQPGKDQPRHPVPEAAALQAPEKLIQRVFARDFDDAKKDRGARLKLIAVLLGNVRDTKDDVALRYLLYRKSLTLATEGGELARALEVARHLQMEFQLDGPELTTTVFEQTQPEVAAADGQRKLYAAALEFQEELLDLSEGDRDRYDLAVRLAKVAEAAAAKGDEKALQTEAKRRGAEVRYIAQEFERIKGARATLREQPADAAANLEVGKFYALARGDWERGLPLMAQGPDGPYSALAKRERAGPKEAKEFLEVAEGWRKLARGPAGPGEAQLLLRAGFHFQQAALHGTGETKTQALARLQEMKKQLPAGYRLGGIAVPVRTLEGHERAVMTVALSADGRRALTAGSDKSVVLWDVQTGQVKHRLEGHTSWVRAVQFAPDGTHALSCGDDATIRMWDLAKGNLVSTWNNPKGWVRCLAYLPDGKRCVAGGDDRVVTLWDASKGQALRTYKGHTGFVLCLAVSKDGGRVLSGSMDFTARLWDVETGAELKKLEGHKGNVTGVALTPNGRQALTTSADGTVRLWDLATGKEVRQFAGHQGTVWCVTVTPDGKQALTGGADRTLRLWDVASGRELRRLEGYQGSVVSVAFAAHGRLALTGGQDTVARLWGEEK
jgi:hypothetical protein